MESRKLREATKQVISEFGAATLLSDRFFNLLDDFGGFREIPISSKIIVKEMLEAGLSGVLYDALSSERKRNKTEFENRLNDFISSSSYSSETVSDLAYELLSGLSLYELLPEINGNQVKEYNVNNRNSTPSRTSSQGNVHKNSQRSPQASRRRNPKTYYLQFFKIFILLISIVTGCFVLVYECYRVKNFNQQQSETPVEKVENVSEVSTPNAYINSVITSFLYYFYADEFSENTKNSFDKICQLAEKNPNNYWANFIKTKGLYKKDLPYISPKLYQDKKYTDSEIVNLLIRADFSPDPRKLLLNEKKEYMMTDDVKLAIKVFAAYHDLPPVDSEDILPLKAFAFYNNDFLDGKYSNDLNDLIKETDEKKNSPTYVPRSYSYYSDYDEDEEDEDGYDEDEDEDEEYY